MLECSVELGVPLNRRSRLAPVVAEDKITGDHFSVVAGHRGGDESVPTSGRISTACALGQLARAGGLGGAVRGGICCRRRRAAKALPVALQGAIDAVELGAASARLSDAEGARVGSRRVRQCGVSA